MSMNQTLRLLPRLVFILSLFILSGCAPRGSRGRAPRAGAGTGAGVAVVLPDGDTRPDEARPADAPGRREENGAPVDFQAAEPVEGILARLDDSLGRTIAARLVELSADPLLHRTQTGIYVYDLTADAPLFALGPDQQLRPASCQKVVTAVTALSVLGPDFRYRTRLVADAEVEDSVLRGPLYLLGGFDPLLSRADADSLAAALRRSGITAVEGDLVADRSLKDTLALGWGWCWDDEPLPLTPLLCDRRPGLELRVEEALRCAGISLGGRVRPGRAPRAARTLAERTHAIGQVLGPMMKRSDNLLAETLFYQIAAASGRPYADRRQTAARVAELLSSLGIAEGTYRVADGSGLSLYNYLTPRLLVALLRHAAATPELFDPLLESLPEAGRDGTLRRRMTSGPARHNVRAKTGTLTGVITLAGYCHAADGRLLAFAVLNQGVLRSSEARAFQDRLCRALTE